MDNEMKWLRQYTLDAESFRDMVKSGVRKHQRPSRLLSLGDSLAIYIDIFRLPDADVPALELGLQRTNLPA